MQALHQLKVPSSSTQDLKSFLNKTFKMDKISAVHYRIIEENYEQIALANQGQLDSLVSFANDLLIVGVHIIVQPHKTMAKLCTLRGKAHANEKQLLEFVRSFVQYCHNHKYVLYTYRDPKELTLITIPHDVYEKIVILLSDFSTMPGGQQTDVTQLKKKKAAEACQQTEASFVKAPFN